MKRTCENCKIKWVCRIKESFEKPLLDARHCIHSGAYPELALSFFELLAGDCVLYEHDGSED